MSNYYQVNWVNGMKITSGHFIDLENHFIQRIQNTIRGCINDLSYGLLPISGKKPELPGFIISQNQSRIKIIQDLVVITPGGHLIQLPAEMEVSLTKTAAVPDTCYLVVVINPYRRVPYGEINESESPLRFPFALPEIQFSLIPVQEGQLHILGENVVPLAKYLGDYLEEDTSYIPPCASIQSHPELIEIYDKVLKAFSDIERVVPEMSKKKSITNSFLLSDLTQFINYNKTEMDWYLSHQPPVFLMEKVHQLARIIKSSYESNNYRMDNKIKSIIDEILSYRYNHLDLSGADKMLKSFTQNYKIFLPKDEDTSGV